MAPKRKLCDEDIESELICDTVSDEYLEDSESDETENDDDDEEQPLSVMHKQVMKWGLRCQANQMHVHRFTGGDRGKKKKEAPHINKESSPLCVFMLSFAFVIDLLVTETNRYYHLYLDRRDETRKPLPDITNPEMFLFLAIILQMGHDVRDRFRDYLTRTKQFFTPFYPNTRTRDRFFTYLTLLALLRQ
jgi:hypothetical protein